MAFWVMSDLERIVIVLELVVTVSVTFTETGELERRVPMFKVLEVVTPARVKAVVAEVGK